MQSRFKQLKIEKTYELLFPRKEQGLAVIWLYERVKNGAFEHGIFKSRILLLEQVDYLNPQIDRMNDILISHPLRDGSEVPAKDEVLKTAYFRSGN
jgi:hypothetical protein